MNQPLYPCIVAFFVFCYNFDFSFSFHQFDLPMQGNLTSHLLKIVKLQNRRARIPKSLFRGERPNNTEGSSWNLSNLEINVYFVVNDVYYSS